MQFAKKNSRKIDLAAEEGINSVNEWFFLRLERSKLSNDVWKIVFWGEEKKRGEANADNS